MLRSNILCNGKTRGLSFRYLIRRYEIYKVHQIKNAGLARVYIVESATGLMAVDVGSIGTAKDVEYYIVNTLGKSLGDLRLVASTHFHIDHIGGIGYLTRYPMPPI